MEAVTEIEQEVPEQEQQQDPPKKLKVKDFAAKIKAKYPVYKDIDDRELTDKIIKKYPVYKDQVDFTEDVKKKVGTVSFGDTYSTPELDSEVQLQFPEKSNEIPTFTDVEVGEDPIALARKAKELKNKKSTVNVPSGSSFGMGTGTTQEVPDDNAQFEYNQIREQLKKEGYDADKLAKDFSDIPDNTFNLKGFTKGELMDDYKNNPQLYERKVGTAKWQSNLLKELNKEGNGQLFANVKTSLDNISNPNIDYNTKRNNIQDIVRDINTHGGENKKEILRNLSVDLSNVYAEAAASSQIRKDNPLFDKLNSNQLAAYQLLEDTNPQEANRYKAALLDDKAIEGNFEAQLQKQEAGRRLDEMGIMMQKSYANEKLNPIIREYEPLLQKANDGTISPAEQARMQQLEEAGKKYKDILDSVAEDEKSLVERYPKASYLDANNFAQELIGQKHSGLDWMAMEMGKATDNTAKGLQDLVTAPFRSEQNNEINQAEVLGGSELSGNSAYLKQGNQTTQSFKPEIDPELQKQIDAIKDNDSLTKREKLSQVTDLLMENGGKWRRTPIEGGKTNIGLSSLMYGVGGLAANLAPFMALELGTGGGASATALRKFTSAFTSAAATGFHDSYVQALEKGSDNPFAEAARVTAINSAAMAGAGTPDAIRKMLGNKTAVGKLVSGMTDDAIELALKAEPKALSNFKKAYESVKNANKSIANTVGENLKTSSKLTAFTTGGQIVNDAISGELKSPNDYAKQAAIETLKFTILGTAGGMLGKIGKKPSSIQLASLHEAGRNPEAFMKALEAMEKDGSISPTEAQQVRSNVEKVSKIFKSSPIIDKLNENQKREYLYNALIKADAKEAASNLPPKQAEKAEMTAMVADKKNEFILDPRTDEQLKKAKERIQKQLEPKKDAQGKVIELPEKEKKESEAELQAIKEIQEESENPKGEIVTVKEEGNKQQDKTGYNSTIENVDVNNLEFTELDGGKIEALKEKDVDAYAEKFKNGETPPPILVGRRNGKLVVIDGHRRVLAAKKAGIKTIKAVVRDRVTENNKGINFPEIELLEAEKGSSVVEKSPKWEEVKQKSTTEFREPEKVKEILEVELPDKNAEVEYTDIVDGKVKVEKVKYIQREAKRKHKLLELLVNCLTK